MGNRTNVLITILLLIILVLVALVAYAFIVRPAVTGYAIDRQVEGYQKGYEAVIVNIMQLAATCQPVPLTYNNQTLNLVAVECLPQEQVQNP